MAQLQPQAWFVEEYNRAIEECDRLEQSEFVKCAKPLLAQFRDGAALEAYSVLKPYAARIAGKVVVDIGCKYGHYAPVFLHLGASKIICFDVVPDYIDIGRKLFSSQHGSVSYTLVEGPFLPLQPESASFVWMNEVISHINPMLLDPLLAEIGRILVPGGAILIADGNNLLNTYCRETLVRIYRCWEQSPPGTQTGRDEVGESFAARRKKLIAAYAPELKEPELEMLTPNTSGLWGDYLKKEVDAFVRTQTLIRRPYRPACSPTAPEEGGPMMERGFYPEQIVMALWNLGFESWEIRVGPTSKGIHRAIQRVGYFFLSWIERLTWVLRQKLSSTMIYVAAIKPHATGDTIPPGTSSIKGGWKDRHGTQRPD